MKRTAIFPLIVWFLWACSWKPLWMRDWTVWLWGDNRGSWSAYDCCALLMVPKSETSKGVKRLAMTAYEIDARRSSANIFFGKIACASHGKRFARRRLDAANVRCGYGKNKECRNKESISCSNCNHASEFLFVWCSTILRAQHDTDAVESESRRRKLVARPLNFDFQLGKQVKFLQAENSFRIVRKQVMVMWKYKTVHSVGFRCHSSPFNKTIMITMINALLAAQWAYITNWILLSFSASLAACHLRLNRRKDT